jgi:hypothetical protein
MNEWWIIMDELWMKDILWIVGECQINDGLMMDGWTVNQG